MINITYGTYTLSCTTHHLPPLYDHYCRHTELVSEYDLEKPNETTQSESPYFIGVSRSGQNGGWPFLVIAQNYTPDCAGFYPGAILIPETNILMIGAGTRILAYSLDPPRLLWEDDADCGFWGWERHGNTIIMSAELEMAVWDIEGRKLWSRYVEPPWGYCIEEGVVMLDIMGRHSQFLLLTGLES